MDVFTYDERQLVALFRDDTRESTISELENMSFQLTKDDAELREITASALSKLRAMTDAVFEELDLVPDFFA